MPKIASNYIEIHICHIKNGLRKYLLLKRSKRNKVYPGIWQMITATVEPGEKTSKAIIREIKEEVNLEPKQIFVVPRVNTFFLAALDIICLSGVFLVITDDTDVILSHEHSEYKWLSFSKAKNLIFWEDQIDSLKLIEKIFRSRTAYKRLVEIM